MTWTKDKAWSDIYIPEIKRILGPHVLKEASVEDDQQRNTDLIVLCASAIRIACRVRHSNVFDRWPLDITIRCSRPSGIKTELYKIIGGWGDLFFYGHASPVDKGLFRAWCLIDLEKWRNWFASSAWKLRKQPWERHQNKDESSEFAAFNVHHYGMEETLIASEGLPPLQPSLFDAFRDSR